VLPSRHLARYHAIPLALGIERCSSVTEIGSMALPVRNLEIPLHMRCTPNFFGEL
jgi:hypothetical protein